MNAETLRNQRALRVLKGGRKREANLDPGFFADGVRLAQFGIGPGADMRDPYSEHDWTYAAINVLCRSVAAVPLKVMKGPRDETAKEVGGDWQKVFDKPTAKLPYADFMTMIVALLELDGEVAVLKIGRTGWATGKETPQQLVPMQCTAWTPIKPDGRECSTLLDPIAGWKVGEKIIPAEAVIHFRYIDPRNPIRGLSPSKPAKFAAKAGYAIEVWNTAFFDNGADPGGVIELGGSMNAAQVAALKAGFNDEHRGPANRGKTLVLQNGMKFTANPRAPKDMEFIEASRMYRDTGLAVRGVPKALLGLTEDLNYANYVGQQRIFYEARVIPLLSAIEDALYGQLFEPIDPTLFAAFDKANVAALNSDFADRVNQANTLTAIGFDINDVNERLKLGMKKVVDVAPADPLLTNGAAHEDNTAMATSIADVVAKVKDGTLPAESAKIILALAHPSLSQAEIDGLIDPATPEAANAPAIPESSTPPIPPANEPPRAAPGILIRKTRVAITDKRAYVEAYLRARVNPVTRRMTSAMRRYLAALSTAQSERLSAWLKANGLKESDLAQISEADVEAILFHRKKWDEAITELAKPYLQASINGALAAAADETGSIAIPMGDPRVTDIMGKSIAQLVQVNETTQRTIRAHLLAASANGETIAEMQARIAPSVGQNNSRALLIARTETGMASSGARFEQMKDAEITEHEWVDSGGPAVRQSHQNCNGETRKIGERFPNGLLHPHEIGADPGEVCNCACEALAIV